MKSSHIALIVDDSPDNREEVVSYLKCIGHAYEEVPSVEAAKEKLGGRAFDYVVLDMCIPMENGSPLTDVTFGKRLLKHILDEFRQEIPVLVVSGVAKDPKDIVEIMKLRSEGAMVSYVVKPFKSEGNSDIVKEIEGLLREKASRTNDGQPVKAKRKKKPQPDGSDVIDLACKSAGHRRWEIKVNGSSVIIGQRDLNILILFGKAQKERKGKRTERHLASLALDDFDIGSKLEPSDLTSLFSKLKTKLWPHLHCNVLFGKKGSWTLGAVIEHLEKAEHLLER